MWRDLEKDALMIGLTLDYFWTLDPKSFEKHVEVFNEKEKQRIKELDTLNYVLGNYIGVAVNEPSKYPKDPILAKEIDKSEVTHMSDDELELQAKILSMQLGGVINDA